MPPTAYVFVTTTNPGPRAACRKVRALAGVERADALFGGPAVVAIVTGTTLEEIDRVIDNIVALPEVVDTDTHIVRPI